MQFSHVTQEEVLNIRKGLTKGSVPKRKKHFLWWVLAFAIQKSKALRAITK